jgi:hypothetical protein
MEQSDPVHKYKIIVMGNHNLKYINMFNIIQYKSTKCAFPKLIFLIF